MPGAPVPEHLGHVELIYCREVHDPDQVPGDLYELPDFDGGSDLRKSLVDPTGVLLSSEPSIFSGSRKRLASSSDSLQG